MNTPIKRLSQVIALTLTSITSVSAQDASALIGEFEAGKLPVEAKEIPLLIPFAIEWDRIAVTKENTGNRPTPNQYHSLTIPDETRMKDVLSALTKNNNAVKFFTQEDTINAFKETYEKAVNQGSAVGMISPDQAWKYWAISRALTAGPKTLEAYQGGYASPEWCLPPLIRCTPPRPALKE